MNLIEIGIYILLFICGIGAFWIMSRLNLIKDINDKQSKAENIISNAKNKANRLLKDTKRKLKL